MESDLFFHRIVDLGRNLKADDYRFCTTTPLTHARVLRHNPRVGSAILREIFGWNRPFTEEELPIKYRDLLHDPEIFSPREEGRYQARVRFSELKLLLLAHSAFPTAEADAVFFGPDTYRFAHGLQAFRDREPDFQPRTCVDVGAGTGAAGLFCASLFPGLCDISLLDINFRALAFANANIALNGVTVARTCQADILEGRAAPIDLIVSNPPYLVDPALRAYRHGGGDWGDLLSVQILEQALTHLSPRGHLLLYTGSAVVDGEDKFLAAATPILKRCTIQHRYEEIDPDVFGEELDKSPYDQADRIASVMLHVRGSDLKR